MKPISTPVYLAGEVPGAWGASDIGSLGTGRLAFHPALRSADHDPGAGDAGIDGSPHDRRERHAPVADD